MFFPRPARRVGPGASFHSSFPRLRSICRSESSGFTEGIPRVGRLLDGLSALLGVFCRIRRLLSARSLAVVLLRALRPFIHGMNRSLGAGLLPSFFVASGP